MQKMQWDMYMDSPQADVIWTHYRQLLYVFTTGYCYMDSLQADVIKTHYTLLLIGPITGRCYMYSLHATVIWTHFRLHLTERILATNIWTEQLYGLTTGYC